MATKPALLTLNLPDFIYFLRSRGISTFHAVYKPDARKFATSHSALDPIVEYFRNEGRDFDSHEGIFGQIGPKSGVLQGAFIHRTCRGAGAGGVRNWTYRTVEDWFRDGLRLSRGMTHKNALAGLWWGGGKGLLARNTGVGLGPGSKADDRKIVYEEYGSFMTALRGCYVTAEDVGTMDQDMAAMFSKTRFTTCIPHEFGGSGNPSEPTARGVLRGLEAALSYIGKSLEGATIAVQGVGHVGIKLIEHLLRKEVSHIIASDIDSSRINLAAEQLRRWTASGRLRLESVLSRDDMILYEDVDALAPCAVGGILNPQTIPNIKAKVICGAANNQLNDLTSDDKLLAERGIIYVPDFLANRMGIVNCADEAVGYVDNDPNIEMHLGDSWDNSIYNLTKSILAESARKNRTPQELSIELAEQRSWEKNPIWGHRGIKIIDSLIRSREWNRKVNVEPQ
ncbi:5790_t:CDS:10 [Paraglomus brasilianum]|uniref:5790_t:CDS:1 n=1 Tax=Paraglomus brasilianum TaxID=144538 RepID=A0A9N8Z7K6_9GLOM|nr:5790_t:CDS:10 [Paraglomus brasilianum]